MVYIKSRFVSKISLILIVFGFAGLFISTLWGNPVSKLIAKVHTESFIKNNANGMELEMKEIYYNPKNSGYDTVIIDNKTKVEYRSTADELGVFYQDALPNYSYPKKMVRFPALVFFLSIGIIGLLLCIGNFLWNKVTNKHNIANK